MLELLSENFEYVAEWAEKEAPEYTGFSLQNPLVGGFIDGAAGNEEWSRENELVNRLAQLLLARRFGTQPNWIVQGWGWFCEMHLLKAIFCYPYRDEFVYAVEHTSWGRDLKNVFKDRKKQPLETKEFMEWRRGTYSGEPARLSWGLTEYFLRFRGEEWPELLEEFYSIREEGSRIDNGDGTWTLDRFFSISADTQREVFERLFGKRALREAAKYFVEGKKYKPKD